MEAEAVPQQKTGASFDIRETVMEDERETAIAKYAIAKQRLFSISNWGNYAGEHPDTFILTDNFGNELSRPATEGDRVKIHLPGPRSFIGNGEDWVQIEKIIEETNKRLDEVFTAITLRPGPNPTASKTTIAHFFDNVTTITFLICRHRTEIVASIHGRNEKINLDTDWMDMFRNMVVAIPAKAGLSNPHWKSLAKGLIEKL
jgi:hypothetical protein